MQAGPATISLDEYLSYGTRPFEVIDGRVMLAPGGDAQQRVITRLVRRLERFVRRGRAGELLESAAFILDGDAAAEIIRLARVPDLAFISRERIDAYAADHPTGRGPWWIAPDLAVVVSAPNERHEVLDQKVGDYLRAGVRIVWLVDTTLREVRTYSPDAPQGNNVFGKGLLNAEPVIAGWAMEAEAVFGR